MSFGTADSVNLLLSATHAQQHDNAACVELDNELAGINHGKRFSRILKNTALYKVGHSCKPLHNRFKVCIANTRLLK